MTFLTGRRPAVERRAIESMPGMQALRELSEEPFAVLHRLLRRSLLHDRMPEMWRPDGVHALLFALATSGATSAG